ncbi:MAG: methyltransferase family protein [Promethearchaeota archaeon]
MDSNKNKKYNKREIRFSHLLHTILPISFIFLWVLDSRVLYLTVFLNLYVPFILRVILFVVFLISALIIMGISYKTLFSKNKPSPTLITGGILKYVRNPMYFGILLIYVAFLCFSISLLSIAYFVIVFLVYNKMVNYEENKLEELFKEDYLKYKKNVPKWIPKLI